MAWLNSMDLFSPFVSNREGANDHFWSYRELATYKDWLFTTKGKLIGARIAGGFWFDQKTFDEEKGPYRRNEYKNFKGETEEIKSYLKHCREIYKEKFGVEPRISFALADKPRLGLVRFEKIKPGTIFYFFNLRCVKTKPINFNGRTYNAVRCSGDKDYLGQFIKFSPNERVSKKRLIPISK